jgi:hypothetical protein
MSPSERWGKKSLSSHAATCRERGRTLSQSDSEPVALAAASAWMDGLAGTTAAQRCDNSEVLIGSIYGMLSPVQDIYAYKEEKTEIGRAHV